MFRGATLVPMAIYLRQTGSKKRVYGFDSFQGFGDAIQCDLRMPHNVTTPMMRADGYSDTSQALVNRKLGR